MDRIYLYRKLHNQTPIAIRVRINTGAKSQSQTNTGAKKCGENDEYLGNDRENDYKRSQVTEQIFQVKLRLTQQMQVRH